MRIARSLTGLVALAILGLVPVGLAGPAHAIARDIPVKGVEPRDNQFFVTAKLGRDYANKRAILERRDRPGAAWHQISKPKTDAKGHIKVRVFSAKNSRNTCFRIKSKAFNGAEAGTSQVICIKVV
jgi:hypothetical protein